MNIIKSLIIIIVFASLAFSQQRDEQIILTGNLSLDSKTTLDNYYENATPQFQFSDGDNKKSPLLAGLLSAVIPGAGEFYAESYLKAGIFVALEAAVITTAVIYDGKGDDKTTEFQNYADDYTSDPVTGHFWSVVKYAEWLNEYEIPAEDPKIYINPDESLPPWQRVNWAELNAVETGSHHLPPHGEQQYYELIGKYPQFSPGWNDFNSSDYHDVSSNFLFYSGERGKANDLYSVASTAVIGIYANHFLSALDAVWTATQFNKDLAVKVRLENIQFADHAEFIPTLYLKYSF